MNEAVTTFEDTSARRWRVFVSSTSFGLTEFRDVAANVIRDYRFAGLQCFEPVMMEDFGAEDGPAREVCTEKVADCDVLVGIIGVRYGDHPPDDQTSYTELEFQTAVDHGLSRLMFLLDEEVARRIEGAAAQGEDRADRQDQLRARIGTDQLSETTRQNRLRARIGTDRVSDIAVQTADDFRKKLTSALNEWVREYSFKRALVDHSTAFKDARNRLLRLGERTGGATLIFGEPGTGKTKVFDTLLEDVPVRHAYSRLAGPVTVRLGEGRDAVEQARAQLQSQLDGIAGQAGTSVAALPPILIALYLEPDIDTGKDVDPQTLSVLRRLFTWDAPRAVVLAETSSRSVMGRLDRDLRWPPGAVITVSDYGDVDHALEQMHRDAPGVRHWPEPETRILAQALGLRPISLYLAAKDIEEEAAGSQRRIAVRIRQQIEAIARERSTEGSYGALIRNSIDHLSPEARDLLALMTVLHPKPTLFPDEMAVALDLSLDLDDAIRLARAGDDSELGANEQGHRDKADELVAELVGRGLLERLSRHGAGREDRPELLTLHPAKVRVIHSYLPLDDARRAEGHARAEAFYRAQVGQAVGGSFSERLRMERDSWWDDAEEWLYHFGHMAPGRAGMTFAALFFDACWWWDWYVKFDSTDRLLDYASRPRVQAVSPEMPEVTRLLTKFRATYPRGHAVALAQIHAEIAGADPAREAGLLETARAGSGVISVVRDLCACLGITELDALFADTAPVASAVVPGPESDQDKTRLHLLGLICGLLADGHWFRVALEPGDAALAATEACYRHAESYFLAEGDAYSVAYTRYALGEVISERGGDPDQLWDEAAAGGDDDGDTELLANLERARADRLRAHGDLEGALSRYGRVVFYGLAQNVTFNPEAGADVYTQALYRTMRLHATTMLAEPLLADDESPIDARIVESRRRLEVMLNEWGGSWKPEPGPVDQAFRAASREAVEESAGAIADAVFPPGPGDAVLGQPHSRYYREVDDLIEKTRRQPWVKGLGRWAESFRR